jgi:4-hydroxy-3-polyprenylbenzoate decarboxylase
VWEGNQVDLAKLPIQHCWPGDAAPLITWGLVVTRGPHKKRQNLGIYRQQVIGRNKRDHALAGASRRGARLPRAPARASRRALPGGGGAGLRSGDHPRRGDAGAGFAVRIPVRRPAARRQDRAGEVPRLRPAGAGLGRDRARRRDPPRATPRRKAPTATTPATTTRSPTFPVFTIERITMRRDPIYHSTYTGKPPDEPAMLGVALNEVFVPLLQKQFPRSSISTCRRRAAPTGWRWSASASSTRATPSG